MDLNLLSEPLNEIETLIRKKTGVPESAALG